MNPSERKAWIKFLSAKDNRGHTVRIVDGIGLEDHVAACLTSSVETVSRVKADIRDVSVRRILDVGSSTGTNTVALQHAFPAAEVVGIEPEIAAIQVARELSCECGKRTPRFVCALAEAIPLPDKSIDLILCHTVIEHVYDVSRSIAEMARVLAPGGVIHLEAPNYHWPKEPHLGIWCIPVFGKTCMRMLAILQGAVNQVRFIDHLQLVHPTWLEGLFRECGLTWENRMRTKLECISDGTMTDVKAYRGLARMMRAFAGMGVNKALISLAMKTGIYPSLLYTIRKSVTCV